MYGFYSARDEFIKQVVTTYVYIYYAKEKVSACRCSTSDGLELLQGSNRVLSLSSCWILSFKTITVNGKHSSTNIKKKKRLKKSVLSFQFFTTGIVPYQETNKKKGMFLRSIFK